MRVDGIESGLIREPFNQHACSKQAGSCFLANRRHSLQTVRSQFRRGDEDRSRASAAQRGLEVT